MKIINNILYIEFAEFVKVGVSVDTLKSAKLREYKCWKFIKDPADGRKVLIKYETLKEKYKTLINNTYGNPYSYLAVQIIEPLLLVKKKDEEFIDNYILDSGESLGLLKKTQYKRICSYLYMLSHLTKKDVRKLGYKSLKNDFHNALSILVLKDKKNNLLPAKFPTTYNNIRKKVNEYIKSGPASVIDKHYNNVSALKMTSEAQNLAIAEFAKKTNDIHIVLSKVNKILKDKITEQALYAYLHKPEIMPLWYFGRHGEREWQKRYEHNFRLYLPTYRDAMWNIDGTKLNFYYYEPKAQDKKAALFQINKVIDVASEVILGYDLLPPGKTEDHQSHYRAIKSAITFAKHKPFQMLYDGQGGHKMGRMQDFYTHLSKVHFKAKPYNGQSKSIESIIKRFQMQIMKRCWFFTGQNVGTKSIESKPNLDYINANKEKLPKKEDINNIVKLLIEEWNNSKHPKYNKTRLQVYLESKNPTPQPVTTWDMIELFWLKTDEITYRKDGIKPNIKGNKDLIFEVVDTEGYPDMEFREKYLYEKFVVKYDPDNLNEVMLYKKINNDLRFIAVARDKERIPRFIGDFKKDTRARIDEGLKRRKAEKKRVADELREITAKANVLTPVEDFDNWYRMAQYGGKVNANIAESALIGGEDRGYTGLYESDREESDSGKILE